MRIKEFELKEETVVEIGKFAILWNTFEHDWFRDHFAYSALKSKEPQIMIDGEKQKELACVINKRRAWFGQSEMDYITDSLHPGNAIRSSAEQMSKMYDFLTQQGDNHVCGCILVIHRLRNNLMHGLKSASQLDDQIDLFKAANSVLETIRRKR